MIDADILAVSIVREDGLVTYSTERGLVGARIDRTHVGDAAGGSIVSRISDGGAGASQDGKSLETYAPAGQGSRRGAVVIVQSYAPIERAARTAQLRVGAVLEGLLILLFLVFVPLLARVSRRITRQIDRIHAQALYDELTGLPNRSHLSELLGLATRRAGDTDRRLDVLVVEVDRIREIDQTLGHAGGDALLVEAARRLQAAVGERSLLAQLGRNEFTIVIEHDDAVEAEDVARGLRRRLEPPALVGDIPIAVDTAIGIACFPTDGPDAETLLKHAKVATQVAREKGVGVLAYSPALDPCDAAQLSLAAELRGLAERGELCPHYQPKIDLATGSIVGYEALAYWQHPRLGLLSPGAFVPLAEQTGGIRYLSRSMLAAAVRQLREWDRIRPGLTIAVNLSAVDLLDVALPDEVEALLGEAGLDPRRLCVELTESAIMADPEQATSTLDRLVAQGARVSIDDFGTGHSSLAYLRHLPVSELKVDRSFVDGIARAPQDRVIVEAAIQLGHSFDLTVVAEGVESAQIGNLLRALGCDQAQGYLYGRPQPAEATTALLATGGLEAA